MICVLIGCRLPEQWLDLVDGTSMALAWLQDARSGDKQRLEISARNGSLAALKSRSFVLFKEPPDSSHVVMMGGEIRGNL